MFKARVYFRSFAVVLGLLFGSCLTARAQYSGLVLNMEHAADMHNEQGMFNGSSVMVDGNLVVSNSNGIVNYSYPISNHTVHGTPLPVSLNYCGSVKFTTYRHFYGGSDQAEAQYSNLYWNYGQTSFESVGSVNEYDSWTQFSVQRPAWIVSVGGFAVQVLHHNTDLTFDYESIGSGQLAFQDAAFNWNVAGYDVCGGMNLFQNNDDRDRIQLLRGDGSILELRNRVFKVDGSETDPYQSANLWTGAYYPDEPNPSGYAVVEINTTAFSRLQNMNLVGSSDVGLAPRIVRWYPGDGLEYVFYEEKIPFGLDIYQSTPTRGNQKSGTSMFYLREINGVGGLITQIDYARHYETMEPSCGRAVMTGLHGHRFSYSNGGMSVDALGRNIKIFYTAVGRGGASGNTTLPLGSLGVSGYGEGSHSSWTGMVQWIMDPEGRRTDFDYDDHVRVYEDFNFPVQNTVSGTVELTLSHKRLSKVETPTFDQLLSYHNPNSSTISSSFAESNTSPPFAVSTLLNPVCSKLEKRDKQNTLLVSVDYSIYNPGGGSYDFIEVVRDYMPDGSTVRGTVTRTYTYDDMFLTRMNPDTRGTGTTWTEGPMTFLALVNTSEEGAGETRRSYMSYGSVTGLSNYHRLPLTSGSSIIQNGAEQETSNLIFTYETAQAHDWGGDSTLAAWFGGAVTKKTTNKRRPGYPQTILKKIDVYEQRTTATQSITWTTTIWDKFAAIQQWLALENDTSQVNPYGSYFEIDAFTTVNNAQTLTAPYLAGLMVESRVENSSGDTLAGARGVYPTSWEQKTIGGEDFALLPNVKEKDILIGVNGVEIETMNYLYVRDGARRGLLARSEDAFGAVTRIWFESFNMPNNFANSAKKLMNDGAVEARGPMSNYYIYEQPFGATRYVRTDSSGGRRELTRGTETTDFGLASGSIDENGWYSAFDYDKNGRLRYGILPGDFPSTTRTYTVETTEELRLYGYSLRSGRDMVKTCNYSTDVQSTTTGATFSVTAQEFIAARPILDEPVCNFTVTSATRRKDARDEIAAFGPQNYPYVSEEEYTAYVRYTAHAGDMWHTATRIDEAFLEVEVTGMNGQPMFLFVESENTGSTATWTHLKTYTFNSEVIAGNFGSSLPNFDRPGTIRIPLSSTLISHLQSMTENEQHDFRLSMFTYGGRVEFGNDDHSAPRFVIDGEFQRYYNFADNSLEYSYNDAQLKSEIVVKVDDERGRYSDVLPDIRRTEKRHEFGPDYRVLKSTTVIGDPASPTRLDSSSAIYSGQGLVLSATDVENNTTATVYDDFGRPLTITAPDGSTVSYEYIAADPVQYGLNNYDYAGAVMVTLMTDENNVTSASFTDGLGRLRREVLDYSPSTTNTTLNITTDYEYDVQDRLTSVVSPSGDVTSYDYDEYGRIRYKTQPDLGTISYRYDKLGRMRFVQDQRQSDNALLGFYQYDDLGRITLIGEAELDGADSSGQGGGEPLQYRKRKGHDELATVTLTNLGRLTDLANPDEINNNWPSHTVATVNASIWATPSLTPPQIDPVTNTNCMPGSASSPWQRSDAPAAAPYLMHLVQMPVTQALYQQPELYNFEDASLFPQFVRTVIHYDELPARSGVAFGHFPSHDDWNRMAPTGTVRNLKGREAAVAYRNDDNQPFHYHVMSYDERGRVEALIRYTENIGFDATYYEYNAMNQVIAVRNVDALRQHAVFYGTDHNGRIDEVWSTLGSITTGTGIAMPSYTNSVARPSVTPDLSYSYTTRNLVAARTYGQIGWSVDYSYDLRGRMTNLTAAGPGPQDGFSETLSFDAAGQITQQVNSHLKGAVSHTHNFSYDPIRRLTNWAHTDPSTTANFGMSYDEVGNRLSESRPGDPNSYSYTDVNHPNQLSTVNSVSWNTAYSYNANGATKRIRKTWQGGGPFGPAPEEKRLAYDMNGLPVRFEKGIIGGSTFEPSELWHYRTAPSGEREQKRQWHIDGTVETAHKYFWTYYGLAGTRRHTVWHGVQQKTDQCNNSGLTERNVWMYPAEYLSYGLSDVAAISENPTLGKTYYIHDHLGSVRVAIKQNGIMSNSIEYEPFGEFIVDYAGLAQLPRLGWIGKERDAETDFGNFGVRNYEFGTGRFLSGDALWEEYRPVSIYQYSVNSPLRYYDSGGEEVQVFTNRISSAPFVKGLPGVGFFVWAVALPRHTSIRVKTDQFDVRVEMNGPRDDHHGVLTRKDYHSWDGDSEMPVTPPEGGNGNYEFENAIIRVFNTIRRYHYLLPAYGTTGPNSNGFAHFLILMAGGTLPEIPSRAYGAYDLDLYIQAYDLILDSIEHERILNQTTDGVSQESAAASERLNTQTRILVEQRMRTNRVGS